LEIERDILKILSFKLVNFSIYDYVLTFLKSWKDISNTNSMDLELECLEKINDLNFDEKILAFVDILKLDIQSSTYPPVFLGLTVLYLGKHICG